MADILTGWKTLFQNVNRVNKTDQEDSEGVQGDLVPELSLSIEDDELVRLKNNWLKDWREINASLSKRQEVNENYWKGKFTYSDIQQQSVDRPEADNLIFESVETALPMFTRANPEPVVESDDEQQKEEIQKEIKSIADEIKFKLKLRGITRNWALFYVGVGKVVYDAKYDRIDFKVIRPQKLILDPKAIVEGGIYLGEYIGEYKTEKARDIAAKFPKAKSVVEQAIKGNMATKITYIEWWTDEYVFWTYEDKVLDKIKNPHWNYETEQPQQAVNEYGETEINNVKVPGINQLPFPQKPYVFLTVFNLGKQPYDETSLVEQNLYLQDLVHKRLKQIDSNIDNINGGYIISGDSGLTKEQAQEAISAIRKGGAIFMKGGNPNNVYAKVNSDGLSQDVYQSLQDYRTELRNIFGTRGSSAQGVATEQTVRGKIIIGQKDESRGGMIAEYLEQMADYAFNWFVQMMYVYYEGFAEKYPNKGFISVKEGSLIPKDSMTRRNEAVDLFGMGAISNVDLYKALELPNPEELNKNLLMWRMEQANPMAGLQGPAGGLQSPVEGVSPEQAQSSALLNQVPTTQ